MLVVETNTILEGVDVIAIQPSYPRHKSKEPRSDEIRNAATERIQAGSTIESCFCYNDGNEEPSWFSFIRAILETYAFREKETVGVGNGGIDKIGSWVLPSNQVIDAGNVGIGE